MYKILGADQKEYGPASADEVRLWLASGRVNGQTKVQVQGSVEWKALSEFPEFAAAAPSGPLPPFPPNQHPRSGLATTSLVLGILSFIGCSILTGIPAIIIGHIAHNRSRRTPQQFGGGGLAVAGFVMGYLSLALIPILAGLMLPALAKAKEKAQRISCVNNMKQIGLAARMWSNDHGGKFPPDFASMSNELVTPKILVCPGDGSKTKAMNWSEFGDGNLTYEFLEPGIEEKNATQITVFQCPIHGNIGRGDGSVQQGGQRPKFRR